MGMSWLLKSYVRLLYKLWWNLYNPKQISVWFCTFPKLQRETNRQRDRAWKIMLVNILIRSRTLLLDGLVICTAWIFSWSLIFLEGNDPMAYASHICAYMPYNWHLLRRPSVWWMTVRAVPAGFEESWFCLSSVTLTH